MKEIRINALVGLRAVLARMGGAWRVWTTARNMTPHGWVYRSKLKEELLSLGVHPENIRRWTNKALEVGVFRDTGKDRLEYVSLDKAAIIFGSKYLYWTVILEQPERLFKKGWRAVLWACFIEALDRDAPISRESLRDITGVCISTQINYEKSGLVDVIPAYVDRGRKPYRHHNDNRYFITKDGRELERIPNVYNTKFGKGIRKAPKKGSIGQYRRELKRSLALQGAHKGLHPQLLNRIYYKALEGAEKASQRYNKETRVFTSHLENFPFKRSVYNAVSA